MAAERPDHVRREAIARARGFPVTYEDARGVLRRPANAFYQYRITVKGEKAPKPARVRTGGGEEIVNTRDEGTLRAAIERAARADMKLFARVRIAEDPEDGSHPKDWPRRDVEVWERGGYMAERALDAVRVAGGIAFGMLKATLDEIEKYPGVVLAVQLRIVHP